MSESPKTRPIRKGDRVTIKQEWCDPGDETATWIACEDEDGDRVLITPLGTGLTFPPRQVVRTDMLLPVLQVPEFVVFSASEAQAHDDGAGFWSNQDGWTTLEGATKFENANGLLPDSTGNDAVWMRAPYDLNYMVLKVEQDSDSDVILFDCWAESEYHAREQAENAYPGCRVVSTVGNELRPFKLVIDAYALDEFGDCPGYALVMLDREFLDRIEKLWSLCKTYDLESVTVTMGPDKWDNEDLSMRGDSLNVRNEGLFWFSAKPKDVDYHCESRGIDIGSLRRIAEAGSEAPTEDEHFQWSKGVLYFAGDPGLVNDLIDLLEDERA